MTVLQGGAELRAAQSRQVSVPGRRLALRRWDPAAGVSQHPPILLLHGVPETSRCFDELAAALATDRVVLAPDLPGLGDSEVRGPYDVRSVTSSLLSLLAAELDGMSETSDADGPRIDVAGHDWGGSIALALAAARPGLVRRLVVISAPYRKLDLPRAWHIPVLGFVPPGLFAGAGRVLVRGMFRYAWGAGRAPDEKVEAYAAAYAARERVRAMAGYYRAAVRRSRDSGGSGDSDSTQPGARAERSLVVWGVNDPPMPLWVGESVVSDLGKVNDPATVGMVTVPGVGHWPLEEAPDAVVPLLSEFLRRP